jgi:hypothetical protein
VISALKMDPVKVYWEEHGWFREEGLWHWSVLGVEQESNISSLVSGVLGGEERQWAL